MVYHLLYNIALVLLATFYLPKFIFQIVFHKKYRNSLLQRLGIGFPSIKKGKQKLAWIHSVSVGETKAIASVAKKLKEQHPDMILISSTITETGYEESRRSIPQAEFHVFLPFDLLWVIKPIINAVQPDIIILCETDFWYNFLKCSHDAGAKIFLANGKLSQRSMFRFQRFSGFTKRLFSLFDALCVQNHHYAERFQNIGIQEQKIYVAGNIKFDGDYTQLTEIELSDWKQSLGIPESDFVLVAGSTHDPEEQILIDAFKIIQQYVANITLLLVPRHPERFDKVAKLLRQNETLFKRYSEKSSEKRDVILIDQMGLLRQCYQIAGIAFVGGSFTPKVGGHNIIEPSWYGVPVLYGPHMHSQPELVELVEHYHAGIQIEKQELANQIIRLLSNVEEKERIGSAGKKMVDDLSGATDRTCEIIFSSLE